MERRGERLKRMTQPCMDHVLNERPCEHSRDETGNAGNHTQQFYPARNRAKSATCLSLKAELQIYAACSPVNRVDNAVLGRYRHRVHRLHRDVTASRSERAERPNSLLSRSFKAGDRAAVKSLFLRSMALKGIAIHGWQDRLLKANAAYRAMVECRRREKASAAPKKRELQP